MRKLRSAVTILVFSIGFMGLLFADQAFAGAQTDMTRTRLDAARNIVSSVNEKDAAMYVRDLAEDVVVAMYGGQVRLRGRAAVMENRANHFQRHPDARNELVHLVEIDDRVMMHDQVWLSADQTEPANIVEIFTFEGDKIVRIDVLQPANLIVERQAGNDDQ